MSIILIVREVIGVSVQELIDGNDKRKNLIQLFSNFSGYPNNIVMKKIEDRQMTCEEMKSFFDIVKVGKSANDVIYFIDEKASSLLSPSSLNSLNTYIPNLINDNDLDILYLANSMDNCNSIESTYTSLGNISFYKSKTPKGLYAVASTVSRWNTIFYEMEKRSELKATSRLTTIVELENIKAVTTWPRVFTPNIFMIDMDSIDNFYTYPCKIEKDFSKTQQSNGSQSFFYFILGSFIVILFLWFLMKLNS